MKENSNIITFTIPEECKERYIAPIFKLENMKFIALDIIASNNVDDFNLQINYPNFKIYKIKK